MRFLALGMVSFIVVGIIVYLGTIYNGLVMVKNNIAKAWSNIDVLLKQRHDEISKLIKTCEAYMQYEKDTLAKVITLRDNARSSQGVAQKAAQEGELTGAINRVFALAENYPDLKAQASFQQLQGRITALESEIADRREFYNESVNNYNIRIQSVPDVLVAAVMGLGRQEMFKVSEADRADVPIDINVPS